MTQNQNMRIELWRWNLASLKAVGNHLEKYPLYTIVPFTSARRLMMQCDYDLEIFARDHIRVQGNKVNVKGLMMETEETHLQQ